MKLLEPVKDEVGHGPGEDGVLVELELETKPDGSKDEFQVLLLDALAPEVEPLEVQVVVHVAEVDDGVEVLEVELDVPVDVFFVEVLVDVELE